MMRANYPWMVNTLEVIERGNKAIAKLAVVEEDLDSCFLLTEGLTESYDSLASAYNEKVIQLEFTGEVLEIVDIEKEQEAERRKEVEKKLVKKNIGFWALLGAAVLELVAIIAVAVK